MATFQDILSTPCKLSTYAKDKNGYAKVYINGKRVYHHRVAYCAAHGLKLKDIEDSIIINMCGRHNCINPKHLARKVSTVSKIVTVTSEEVLRLNIEANKKAAIETARKNAKLIEDTRKAMRLCRAAYMGEDKLRL